MPNNAPVSVVPPDVTKKPSWFDQEVAVSKVNPRFEDSFSPALVSKERNAQQGSGLNLVHDLVDPNRSTMMRPAQFGWVMAPDGGKFMTFYELWEVCRDNTEEAALAAIHRFGQQGGRDPWGSCFNTAYEFATTANRVHAEKPGTTVIYGGGAGFTGDRRSRHTWGVHHRSGRHNDRPGPPTLSHILVGNTWLQFHHQYEKKKLLCTPHFRCNLCDRDLRLEEATLWRIFSSAEIFPTR